MTKHLRIIPLCDPATATLCNDAAAMLSTCAQGGASSHHNTAGEINVSSVKRYCSRC